MTTEAAIEPELAIVDAHHHLWEGSALVAGSGRYLLPDFAADVATGHRIVATVYIEAGARYRTSGPEALRPVGEVEFARETAVLGAGGSYGPTQYCKGIVAHADLRLGDGAAAVLDALEAAAGGRLRGIRQMASSDPDPVINKAGRAPGLLRDPAFRAGFAHLARRGLSFDAWLLHPQLADAADLAQAFPDATIIVDHAGGPLRLLGYAARLDEAYRDWRQGVETLARYPNVVMKLGGLGMRLFELPPHHGPEPVSAFLAEQWRPYVEPCIEAFGADRCLFESNFPVDRDAGSYAAVWNAFKRLAAGASPDEKAAMFAGTAIRTYKLTL